MSRRAAVRRTRGRISLGLSQLNIDGHAGGQLERLLPPRLDIVNEGNPAMGRLLYGDSNLVVEIDDRTLAHVHLVIGSKLRRREGFFFSWKDDPITGNGRSSIWLEPSIPLYFTFASRARHVINRDWLEELSLSANQPQGLYLTPEPGQDTPQPRSRLRV